MHIQRIFAPEGESVSEARRFVRGALQDWGADDVSDEAVLVTSELVTNAVMHAGTTVRVGLDLDSRGLRLEVQDLHPDRTLPLGLDGAGDGAGDGAEHGRGLFIAASLASAWGVDYDEGRKRVWVRFDHAGAVSGTSTRTSGEGAAATGTVGVAAVAVAELSEDGDIRSWNADAERLFGWEAEAVLGLPWKQVIEPVDDRAPGGRAGAPAWEEARWQGTCVVQPRSGAPVETFASRVASRPGRGSVLLLVPAARREILEWPAPRARSTPVSRDPLGLREDALTRLGFQAYLDLVVERTRDQLGARAAYLLLVHDLDADYEVNTVSGLSSALRGMRLEAGSIGVPDPRNPHLPVVIKELDDAAASWLTVEGLCSLVVAPVVAEGRVIGALAVASDHQAGFSDEQAVLLQRIGGTAAPAADRARLRAAERERRGWLTLLAESSDLLAASLDQEMTMAITGQIVVPRLATWCALYLDDSRGRSVLHQVWHRDEREVSRLRAGLERAGPPEVGTTVQEQGQGQGQNGVLHIPLVTRGRRIGVLTLGRDSGEALRGEARVVAESVARRSALAIDNARVHGELQAVGDALQRSLLPVSIPSTHLFEVGVVYQAAGERVLAGGDFFDLFPVGAGRWCYAVGDVCGTGAEAAAVTGLARHTIRALASAGFPVASILERLNTAILEEGERSRFLTVVCGTLEADGARIRMSAVSAGHPLPFVVRRGGAVEQIGRPQSLLGVMEHVTFLTDETFLEPGDLFVAVTDGVLERRDGSRMLSEEGLVADLREVGNLPAQAVAERIRRLVAGFAPTPQADDMAVLALRVATGRGSP